MKSAGDGLVCKWKNIQKHEERKSCKINKITRVKGSEKRSFIFIFRLNIVLHESYQANEVIVEIEEWKQKVPDNFVKIFIKVLLGVLEISIVP